MDAHFIRVIRVVEAPESLGEKSFTLEFCARRCPCVFSTFDGRLQFFLSDVSTEFLCEQTRMLAHCIVDPMAWFGGDFLVSHDLGG